MDGEIMFETRQDSMVLTVEIEKLFRCHTCGFPEGPPSGGQAQLGITPGISPGVLIALAQHPTCHQHADALTLGSHTIIEIALAMAEMIIEIAQLLINCARHQHDITIEIIDLHGESMQGGMALLASVPTKPP